MTPRQRRFVEEYLIDLNATQTAGRAGYSPRSDKNRGQINIAPGKSPKALAAGIYVAASWREGLREVGQ